MSHHQPHQVIAFHSCDKEVGLRVLNGRDDLIPSDNKWDWLGYGIYFWEQNPSRALDYAIESSEGKQHNKIPIKTPFVLGAIIDLGNCLNLIEPSSISLLKEAYAGLVKIYEQSNKKFPVNEGSNRRLDSAVFKSLHQIVKTKELRDYDTIRSPFYEGDPVYPGSSFTERGHIEICVINPDMIQGYFLPKPIKKFNPNL